MSSSFPTLGRRLASLFSQRILIGSIGSICLLVVLVVFHPRARAVEGTLNVTATTASYSGTMTQAGNQPIRTAFGPLRLDYKSGPNSWTTGFLIREGDGNVSIGSNITSADFNSNSKLRVLGIVESTTGGFKFPDGTTQTTAASVAVGGGWTDGGTNVYTTTTTDNVAIGTTSPLAKLHVQGAAAVSGPGTISSTGATVTGSSTTFTTTFQLGDAIIASGQTRIVSAIASDTSLTTSLNFNPVIGAGTSYTSQPAITKITDSGGNTQMIVTGPGLIGIGTTSPGVQLQQLYDTTNALNSISAHSITRIGRATSGTIGPPRGMDIAVQHQIGSGLSVGASTGFVSTNLRNYIQTNDLGTETALTGMASTYGHYNTDASTPITTTMYGMRITPYARTGTITNMYDLYIDALSTGGTVTNRWSLYQNDATTQNYFAGKVGIGTTAPVSLLHVVGNARIENVDNVALDLKNTTTGVTHSWYGGSTAANGFNGLGLYDGSAYRMVVLNSNGNIGIGSTAPGAKLEVAGNINSSTGAIQTAGVTRIANDGVGTFAAGTTIGGSTITAAVVDKTLASGRLTLTSGTPVTTADVTAATTVYYTPYDGDVISLYDGTSTWTTLTFSELSLALTNYTTNTNYDIWAYNNSGTVALESTAWTNDTTRATAIVQQNGVWVKSGATTRRLLGTIRITGTTGQTEDSRKNRLVFNVNNRVRKSVGFTLTSSWTKTGAGEYYEYLNNNDTTQFIGMVRSLNEDTISVKTSVRVKWREGYTYARMLFSIDTPGNTAGNLSLGASDNYGHSNALQEYAFGDYVGAPGLGYHKIIPTIYYNLHTAYTSSTDVNTQNTGTGAAGGAVGEASM